MFESGGSAHCGILISTSEASGVMDCAINPRNVVSSPAAALITVDTEVLGLVMHPPRGCSLRFTLRFAHNSDHGVRFAKDDQAEPIGAIPKVSLCVMLWQAGVQCDRQKLPGSIYCMCESEISNVAIAHAYVSTVAFIWST